MAIGPIFRPKNRDPKPSEYSRINSDKTVPYTFSELGMGRHTNMWLFSTSKSYAASVSSKSSSSSSTSSFSTYNAKPSGRTTPDSKRPKSRDRKPNDDSKIKSPKALPTFAELGMGRHSHMWLFDAKGWKRLFGKVHHDHQSCNYDQ